MDGRQVAVLVPTTVLAQQHYNAWLITQFASNCSRAFALARNSKKSSAI
jgi:transcription-repair coupling factor (superfamily II helicase)